LFLNDLKFALRFYRKRPGFLLAVVSILGLGIGATTAVFSVANAVILKPLPYPESERIVFPWRQTPPGVNLGYREIPWGVDAFHAMNEETRTYQSLGAFKHDSFNLTGAGNPELLSGLRVSAGFFPTLGVEPQLGRWFTKAEDQPGHGGEVILSDKLWRERFGGDIHIIGRPLDLNGASYLVIGIMPSGFVFPHGEEMPASFDFPSRADLWVPLAAAAAAAPDEDDSLAIIGKLQPAISYSQAQSAMDLFSAKMEAQAKSKGWFSSRITSLVQQVAGDMKTPLLLTLAAVAVVLFIVCANIANLLLVSSMERRAEFTLRAAIGAGQGHLVRQILTENFVLAGLGGFLGIFIAFGATFAIKRFGPHDIPRLQEANLDLNVLFFVIAITLLSGLLFGIMPVLGVRRRRLTEALNERGLGATRGAISNKVRGSLTVIEVALALVLMVAASLLVETFSRLLHTNAGFNSARVLTFELSLPESKYSAPDKIVALYQHVLQSLSSAAGIEAASITKTVPLTGATDGSAIRIPGYIPTSKKDQLIANYNIAGPDYFRAVGTPLLEGREFGESDTAQSQPVVIINSAMARKFFAGHHPIGMQVGLRSPRFPLMNIIGVVEDVKHLSLKEDPGPEMYVPYTQKPYPSMLIMSVVLRTRVTPEAVTRDAATIIHSIDSDLPLANITTLEAIRANSTSQARFSMLLMTSFGGLALVLACLGMYGVISYSTTQRMPEIGVRMAFGASRSSVFRMMFGQAARLGGYGAVIGIVAALLLTRTMRRFVYGIEPYDPATLLVVCIVLAVTIFLASYFPCRRAMQVDPIVAIRYK
jgi:putative ABC transport system permease protein